MDQPSSTESNALTLRIKFKSASLQDFISRYGADVSPGGIFIRTKQPVDVGTSLQFEFLLADGSALLAGLGTVAWVRENDPARANNVPGMGLRFDKLTIESQQNHQTILAEKARKEGKPQGTPYPPTAFVAPATRPSPAPEPLRSPVPATAAAPEPPKAAPAVPNFSKTLPAPASLANRLQQSSQQSSEFGVDDFDGGGKTEISDKPLDYFIQEAEAAQRPTTEVPVLATGAPSKGPVDEWKADANTLEGIEAPPPAPDDVNNSQAYATGVPEPAPEVEDPGEPHPSDKDFFTSMLDTGETSESANSEKLGASEKLDDSSGVPLEETMPEKTEELSLSGARPADADGPIDLGGSLGDNEPIEAPIPSLEDFDAPPKKRRGGTGLLIGGVVLAGAAAFAAVYLWQSKPWQSPSGGGETPAPVVKKAPALAPVAAPAVAPEGAKPAAAEPPKPADEPKAAAAAAVAVAVDKKAEEKTAAERKAEEKAAAAEKAAAEKAAAAAEKAAAADKKAAEKAAAAEQKAAEKAAAAERAAAEKAALAEKKAEAKSKGKATKTGAGATESAVGDKPAAPQEEIYRLSFRTSPIGAEVLIDGEYFARTPCERRILDPKKTYAITLRKEGYEPHERMIGSSDNWVKKGDNERVLAISVTLKKVKLAEPAAPAAPAPVAPKPAAAEEKPAAPKPAPDEPDKI